MYEYRHMQEARLPIVAELYKRGYSYPSIRREVMARLDLPTYSLQTVSRDVHRLLNEWRKNRITDMDQALQLELERIDDIIREAWGAWDKSKTDYEKRKVKQFKSQSQEMSMSTENPNGGIIKAEQQKEEVICYGDPRYLDVVNRNLAERRKRLGLYSPEKKEVTGDLTFANLLMQTGIIDDKEE